MRGAGGSKAAVGRRGRGRLRNGAHALWVRCGERRGPGQGASDLEDEGARFTGENVRVDLALFVALSAHGKTMSPRIDGKRHTERGHPELHVIPINREPARLAAQQQHHVRNPRLQRARALLGVGHATVALSKHRARIVKGLPRRRIVTAALLAIGEVDQRTRRRIEPLALRKLLARNIDLTAHHRLSRAFKKGLRCRRIVRLGSRQAVNGQNSSHCENSRTSCADHVHGACYAMASRIFPRVTFERNTLARARRQRCSISRGLS